MPTITEVRPIARENFEENPELVGGYFFPHPEEVRIVYVDPTTVLAPDGRVHVYPFTIRLAEESTDRPFLIAVVHPEDVGKAALPDGWGSWPTSPNLP